MILPLEGQNVPAQFHWRANALFCFTNVNVYHSSGSKTMQDLSFGGGGQNTSTRYVPVFVLSFNVFP